jgi:Ca2+-binding RTX toxin-like protein
LARLDVSISLAANLCTLVSNNLDLKQLKTMASSEFNVSNLNGSNGFIVNGSTALSLSGYSVSGAGDVNGDGIDDFLIGVPKAFPTGPFSGQSYLVFGSSSGFSSVVFLANLSGSDGFAINAIAAYDYSGRAVSSAGDINGDGIDDFLIGADQASPGGSRSGQSYVVFGSSNGFGSSFSLASLNGSNGFILNGINPRDRAGTAVSSIGDINGDGLDDLIIGTRNTSASSIGQSYVVFGRSGGFSSSLNLSSLNGSNGFTIKGIQPGDLTGSAVSDAGDVNGDGIDDLVIGAANASPNGDRSGQSYVVFGRTTGFGANFRLSYLNGSNGFAINGINPGDSAGSAVSSVGDVNGDGIDDLVIGAADADPNGDRSGQSYVVFGRSGGFSSSFNLSTLNGSNGFAVNGINAYDRSGIAVSGAGDINGDGIDDLLIGADGADPSGNVSGQSYVVFGRSGGFSSSLNLSTLNGSNGFAVNGIFSNDGSGFSVSGAGDVNGDGIDDLVIGAPGASPAPFPGGPSRTFSGQTYVVYGFIPGLTLTSPLIDATNLTRGPISVNLGLSKGTLVIQQPLGPKALNLSGYSIVKGTAFADTLVGNGSSNSLSGNAGNDKISGGKGNDTLIGGSGNDILDGGTGTDTVDYSSLNAGITLRPTGVLNKLSSQSSGAIDQLISVETIIADADFTHSNTIDASTATGIVAINANLLKNSLVVNIGAAGKLSFNVQNFANVTGTNSNDTITGNSGNNRLNGGGGNDTISGGQGNDSLNGGAGNDTLIGGSGHDVLYGGKNRDILKGDRGNDILRGGSGNDSLEGGLGQDILLGGRGDDFLAGGAENDRLTGGTGSDRFVFKTEQAFSSANLGSDRIRDFSRTAGNIDKIVISFKTFTAGTSFASVYSDALAATSGAYITFSTATGKLFYNQNGSAAGLGGGSQFATLKSINGHDISHTNTLLATDFSIVA